MSWAFTGDGSGESQCCGSARPPTRKSWAAGSAPETPAYDCAQGGRRLVGLGDRARRLRERRV